MSGLSISGTLVNVYEADKRNESDDSKFKLQFLSETSNRNGDTRMQMLDISCKDEKIATHLRTHQGKVMSIPVGVFSPADSSNIIFFVAPGTSLADLQAPSSAAPAKSA